ncbi:MAG: TonB family protein [Spirosomataceae bacterium]
MKTLFHILFLCLFIFSASAQELKKVKNTITSNPFTNEREEYYVLKSDKKIKHGSYERRMNEKIIETGFYKNNLKDSLWTQFFTHTGTIKEQGTYTNNERTGIWQFNNSKNQLEYSYDFTNHKLISVNEAAVSKTAWVLTSTDTAQTAVEHAALYMGGTSALGEVLARNIRFPTTAMKKGVNGKVFVTFIVDEEGKVSNHKVTKHLDRECDEEALRVCRLLTEWIPAGKEGKPVKSLQMVPVSFNFAGVINR